MWLPLQKIKMGRLHLAITVLEENIKVILIKFYLKANGIFGFQMFGKKKKKQCTFLMGLSNENLECNLFRGVLIFLMENH